jgi:hypothetical protein
MEGVRQGMVKNDVIEPNEEEKRNGWTTQTLTAYVAMVRASSSKRLDPGSKARRAQRPRHTNNHYSPFRWQR